MADSNRNRRRHYWIDPSFQGRYLLRILALQLITMVVTALVSLMLAFILLSPRFSAGPQWTGILIAFAAIALILAGGLTWLAVRISHKMCGPVFRITADLKSFREGAPLRPIKLRDGDELHELADSINETLQALKPEPAKPLGCKAS